MAAQALKVAVIIPVYNTTELFLQESLDSILAQDQADLNLDIRIFIHDDGSSLPETASTLKHYQSRHPRYGLKQILNHTTVLCCLF
jgi:glycosyltransferase involved in cell wall biosynthesis